MTKVFKICYAKSDTHESNKIRVKEVQGNRS